MEQPESADFTRLSRFDGQVAVVLGGGAGIGQAVCHALAQLGAAVVVVDRDLAAAESVAQELRMTAKTCDVTSRSDLAALLDAVEAELGPVSVVIDIVGAATLGSLLDLTDAGWDAQFDVVLRHAFLTIQLAVQRLERAGGGAIVLVGSTSGAAWTTGQTAYGTAKAALHHLVHGAGREFAGRGIRINAVAPGYTRTPRLVAALPDGQWDLIGSAIPRGSAADPAEIAAPIVFLASASASYITGQVLLADGGITGMVPSAF